MFQNYKNLLIFLCFLQIPSTPTLAVQWFSSGIQEASDMLAQNQQSKQVSAEYVVAQLHSIFMQLHQQDIHQQQTGDWAIMGNDSLYPKRLSFPGLGFHKSFV